MVVGRAAQTTGGAVVRRRPATGPLPQLSQRMLSQRLAGPRTLEDRLLPGFFLFAFVVLMVIQGYHALGG